MRVIVVGAGISGLSAAYILQKNGVDVTVLEKGKNVGGKCQSVKWHDGWVDLAAEMMVSVDDELNQLFSEIGLDTHMRPMDNPDCIGGNMDFKIWRDGRFHRFNLKKVDSLLKSGILNNRGKARFILMLPTLLRQMLTLKGVRPDAYQVWRSAWADNVSLEEWLERVNPQFLTYFAESFIDLFWGYNPADISRAFFLNMMACLNPKLRVITTDEGYGLFPRTLAEKLNVKTQARVIQVDVGNKPVTVAWENSDTEIKKEKADAVIMAVPGCFVNDIVDGMDSQKRNFFDCVRYNPKEMVYFKLNKTFDDMLPWHIFPKRTEPYFSGIAYGPSQITPNFKVLRVNMKTDFVLKYMDCSDDQVLDAMQLEIAKRYPEFEKAIEDRIIARWREAIPQFYPGYIKSLDYYLKLPETKGLAFAGDYLTFSTTGGAYRSGQLAASSILNQTKEK